MSIPPRDPSVAVNSGKQNISDLNTWVLRCSEWLFRPENHILFPATPSPTSSWTLRGANVRRHNLQLAISGKNKGFRVLAMQSNELSLASETRKYYLLCPPPNWTMRTSCTQCPWASFAPRPFSAEIVYPRYLKDLCHTIHLTAIRFRSRRKIPCPHLSTTAKPVPFERQP